MFILMYKELFSMFYDDSNTLFKVVKAKFKIPFSKYVLG